MKKTNQDVVMIKMSWLVQRRKKSQLEGLLTEVANPEFHLSEDSFLDNNTTEGPAMQVKTEWVVEAVRKTMICKPAGVSGVVADYGKSVWLYWKCQILIKNAL